LSSRLFVRDEDSTVGPKKKKSPQENAKAASAELLVDGLALTAHEAAVLRFLHMGYVGLLKSDKEALSGLEAKGLAQYLMGGWLLTSLGKSYAQKLGPDSKAAPEDHV